VIRRVGGGESIPIDVRIIVATNKDLEVEVREGRFREDLFYRLKVIRINLPPLRERREDIPLLIQLFAGRFCKEFNRPPISFTPEAVAQMAARPWPGNVRELQNELKRLVLCAAGPRIALADLEELIQGTPTGCAPEAEGQSLEESLAAFEKRLLIQALQASGGNQAQAARALGLSRPGLFKKLKRFGIEASAPTGPPKTMSR
jgi:DNA-binding NtrC family response regulator